MQATVVAIAAALAAWIALDYDFDSLGGQVAILVRLHLTGRPASIAALGMLLAAAIVMVRGAAVRLAPAVAICRDRARHAAGLRGGLDLAAGRHRLRAWLHRSVIAMTATAAAVLTAGFGLRTILPPKSDWIERGQTQRAAAGRGGRAGLAAVLIEEGVQFATADGVSMRPWAIALVGVALGGLAAASIALAVRPQLDPLELDDRGRQVYVYAAEAILVLLGVHVRLTMPWLFQDILRYYWMLVVVAVAYLSTGSASGSTAARCPCWPSRCGGRRWCCRWRRRWAFGSCSRSSRRTGSGPSPARRRWYGSLWACSTHLRRRRVARRAVRAGGAELQPRPLGRLASTRTSPSSATRKCGSFRWRWSGWWPSNSAAAA